MDLNQLLKYRDKKFDKSQKLPVSFEDYVLCIANIEKRKKSTSPYEATKLSKKKLVLVGHIREKEYFNTLEIDNNSVIYYGSVENHSYEFLSLLLNAKCFVLPSTLETPGLAALEAAALGDSNNSYLRRMCKKNILGE